MLLDINAYIGHWAFRQLRHNTAETLEQLMDANNIDKAIVASINGTLYKNVHSANIEIAEEIKNYKDRLIPFATINPLYANWEYDLEQCKNDLGFKGVRLYPQYHRYSLLEPIGLKVVDAATELGFPVQVPMTLVDRRQRHSWDIAKDITPEEFEKVISLRPNTKWMILNSYGINVDNISKDANYIIDFANPYYQTLLRKEIPTLIEKVSSKHIAFGTDMPFRIPEAAILKLENLEIGNNEKENIAWKNAMQMLKL